jgi:hypothetical protein
LLLHNKNNENKNINVEIGNFVILYNREAERWLAEYIETNNNSDNILKLNGLIESDYVLTELSSDKFKTVYEKPVNLFDYIHGDFTSTVESGDCKAVIYNYVFKPNDINSSIEDKFTRPSLAWERGVGKVGENSIIVYKDNFDITKTQMSYYKIPRKIDIAGYITPANKQSTDINPDTSDYISNLILDRVVSEVKREFEANDFQLAKTRERGF